MKTTPHNGHLPLCSLATLWRLVVSVFLLTCLTLPLSASIQPVRVGLVGSVGKVSSVTILCHGAAQAVDTASQAKIELPDGSILTFRAASGNIEVSVPDADPVSFKGPVRLLSSSDETRFEITSSRSRYKVFKGIIEIDPGSALTVVNELSIEDYVCGVVPVEVPKSFHPEAQKALVVAIRTYALKSVGRHKSQGYALCDTTHCQGFSGRPENVEWAERLVNATRGQVITYHGELICATYSTDCGGITQSNEDAGYGRESWPYLRSVVDGPGGGLPVIAASKPAPKRSVRTETKHAARGNHDSLELSRVASHDEDESASPEVYGDSPADDASFDSTPTDRGSGNDYCCDSPVHTWSKTYSVDDLVRIFGKNSAITRQIGRFCSMEFTDFDSSNRVKAVHLVGDRGETDITGTRFRDLAGSSVIKSTCIKLSKSEDGRYVVNGKGFGHGVGLCSFGANGMAKSHPGVTYKDILKHYYTGVEITTLAE